MIVLEAPGEVVQGLVVSINTTRPVLHLYKIAKVCLCSSCLAVCISWPPQEHPHRCIQVNQQQTFSRHTKYVTVNVMWRPKTHAQPRFSRLFCLPLSCSCFDLICLVRDCAAVSITTSTNSLTVDNCQYEVAPSRPRPLQSQGDRNQNGSPLLLEGVAPSVKLESV